MTRPGAPRRLSCCVPHCGRTRRDDGKFDEWLCMEHWRLVPSRPKKAKRIADAMVRKTKTAAVALLDGLRSRAAAGTGNTADEYRAYQVAERAYIDAQGRAAEQWERCKTAAIDRALGIR